MLHRIIGALLQPFWRLTRGLTLGTQGIVVDDQNRVLLVRHGYRTGWHFPGGGVERGESTTEALRRELDEETGVKLSEPPQLHGLFTNSAKFPGDHIAVYIVRSWDRPTIPKPNAEIAEAGFFPMDALPDGTVEGVRRRLREAFGGTEITDAW